MAKSKFTQEEVNAVMEQRGVNRKSALKFLNRTVNKKAAPAVARVPEVTPARKSRKAKTVVEKAPQTEAGKARSAGVQLFILAGRPTKQQFIAVYGETGPRLTWDQRAALGVDAAHFQKALKSGKRVAPVQQ
jgi:hypothetical protein